MNPKERSDIGLALLFHSFTIVSFFGSTVALVADLPTNLFLNSKLQFNSIQSMESIEEVPSIETNFPPLGKLPHAETNMPIPIDSAWSTPQKNLINHPKSNTTPYKIKRNRWTAWWLIKLWLP